MCVCVCVCVCERERGRGLEPDCDIAAVELATPALSVKTLSDILSTRGRPIWVFQGRYRYRLLQIK